ncbi:hypothetical protein TNCV_1674541 [Trichonephila clavipes]|nr:hypothetical protein TNCV_1674541 [Trichonephila clavipes]
MTSLELLFCGVSYEYLTLRRNCVLNSKALICSRSVVNGCGEGEMIEELNSPRESNPFIRSPRLRDCKISNYHSSPYLKELG